MGTEEDLFGSAVLRVCYVPLDGTLVYLAPLLNKVSEEERGRAHTFQRPQDQQAFLAGRVLVRRMLSEAAGTMNFPWLLKVQPSGKPAVVRSPGAPDLRFNLSHTAGLVAAVVALGREVGIDAEATSTTVDYVQIAEQFFAPSELDLLRSTPSSRKRETFLSLWTIKEAYVKACGEGLARSLSSFSFELQPLELAHDDHRESQQRRQWFFWQHQPTPSHVVALAAQQERGECLVCRPKHRTIEDLLA